MSNASEAVQGLENASQKHEKEIVIDLGSDRIQHFVGVYFIIFLAVLSKLTEVVGDKLSCYPASNVTVDVSFISYAKSYCWETVSSSSIHTIEDAGISTLSNKSCSLQYSTNSAQTILLKNPTFLKTFLQWLPYGMLCEALLFALPSVWWHFRVGARLMGHLKFMKLLLDDIFNALKPLERGVYRGGSAYDIESYFLDGWVKYRPEYRREEISESQANTGPSRPTGQTQQTGTGHRNKVTDSETAISGHRNKVTDSETAISEEKTCNNMWLEFLYGGMLDRHFFSMLCFENFSSLEQHPYILSVYKVTKTAPENYNLGLIGESKIRCILRLVCNRQNFNGTFLVRSYLMKHAFGFFGAFFALVITICLLVNIGSDVWMSESFQCDVIYHEDKCMICTLNRKAEVIAYLLANIVLNLVYLIIAFCQWIFIRSSKDRASSHYFEELCDTGSVALRKVESEETRKKK